MEPTVADVFAQAYPSQLKRNVHRPFRVQGVGVRFDPFTPGYISFVIEGAYGRARVSEDRGRVSIDLELAESVDLDVIRGTRARFPGFEYHKLLVNTHHRGRKHTENGVVWTAKPESFDSDDVSYLSDILRTGRYSSQ